MTVQAVLVGCFCVQLLSAWERVDVGWTLKLVAGVAQGWLVVLALQEAALVFLLAPTFSLISEDALEFWMRLTYRMIAGCSPQGVDWLPDPATAGQSANDQP